MLMTDTDYICDDNWDKELTLRNFERVKTTYPDMTEQQRLKTFFNLDQIKILIDNGLVSPDALK